MAITCFIRYEIDPFQREAFRQYAENWHRIIPRLGGRLLGYFLPLEGTNYEAWGLVGFDTLAAYESYRARLRADAEAMENFAYAQRERFILREERTWRRQEAHRAAQLAGRGGVFDDYRLPVASVIRDYGMTDRAQAPAGAP